VAVVNDIKDINIPKKEEGESYVKSAGEAEFVGEDRIKLVDDIELIYDSVKKSKKPHWISIEANSGWGKTRLIQEFYKRLAAKQVKGNQYWPSSILKGNKFDQNDVSHKRKLIFPKQFDSRKPGNYPEFLWWGVACSQRNGSPYLSLIEDFKEIMRHAPGIDKAQKMAWHKEGAWNKTIEFAKERIEDGINTVIQNPSSDTLVAVLNNQELVDNVFKFCSMGLVTGLGIKAYKHIKKKHGYSVINASDGDLPGIDNDDILKDMVMNIRRISIRGLPTVIYIEDFHTAPPLLHHFLDEILHCNSTILVITSSWPQQKSDEKNVSELLSQEKFPGQITTIKTGEGVESPLPEVRSNKVPEWLPKDALQSIISSHYPKTSFQVKELISKKYNSALEIELLCTLPKCVENFTEGNLQLTENEINYLPRSISEFYLDVWKETPVTSKQFLSLSTLLLSQRVKKWPKEFVARCIKKSPYLKSDFSGAELPKCWLKQGDNDFYSFIEDDHIEIAKTSLNELFFKRNTDGFLETVMFELIKIDLSNNDEDNQFYAELVISFFENDLLDNVELVFSSILYLQESLSLFPKEVDRRLELGQLISKLKISECNELLEAKYNYYLAIEENGNIDLSLTNIGSLISKYSTFKNVDKKLLHTIKLNYAISLFLEGKYKKAIPRLKELYKPSCTLFGKDSEETHQIQLDIIINEGQYLLNDMNIVKTEKFIKKLPSHLVDKSRVILNAEWYLAQLIKDEGDVMSCTDILKHLYLKQSELLGSTSKEALRTKLALIQLENKHYISIDEDTINELNIICNKVAEVHGEHSIEYVDLKSECFKYILDAELKVGKDIIVCFANEAIRSCIEVTGCYSEITMYSEKLLFLYLLGSYQHEQGIPLLENHIVKRKTKYGDEDIDSIKLSKLLDRCRKEQASNNVNHELLSNEQ
jgi:hypothetical protein